MVDAASVDLISKNFRSKDHPGLQLTVQVTPDDCTGCGVCVDVCPARSKTEVKHKAIDMMPVGDHFDREAARYAAFHRIEPVAPGVLDPATVKSPARRATVRVQRCVLGVWRIRRT